MTVPAPPPIRLPPPRRSREDALRRGWGVYFAIWALTILLLLLVASATLAPSLASVPYRASALFLLGLLIVIVAGLTTVRHFRRVWQETHFPLWRVGLGFIVAFMVLLVSIGLAAFAPPVIGLTGSGLALLVVAAILAYQLRWSFQVVPPEAWFGLGVLLVSILGSAGGYALTHNPLTYGAFWLLTVLGWAGASGWALASTPRQLPIPGSVGTP